MPGPVQNPYFLKITVCYHMELGVSTIRPGPFQNTCSGEILARIFDRGVNN